MSIPPTTERQTIAEEHGIPSVDTCAICADGECGGNCYGNLDFEGDDDYDEIERVQRLVRAGQAWELLQTLLDRSVPGEVAHGVVAGILARAENRAYP